MFSLWHAGLQEAFWIRCRFTEHNQRWSPRWRQRWMNAVLVVSDTLFQASRQVRLPPFPIFYAPIAEFRVRMATTSAKSPEAAVQMRHCCLDPPSQGGCLLYCCWLSSHGVEFRKPFHGFAGHGVLSDIARPEVDESSHDIESMYRIAVVVRGWQWLWSPLVHPHGQGVLHLHREFEYHRYGQGCRIYWMDLGHVCAQSSRWADQFVGSRAD